MKKIKTKTKFDILIVIILIILSVFLADKFIQNDTFYSITIGKDILKNGVDMIDHYSIHNLPYTYPHWLFDVLIYLYYSFTGLFGLYVFNVVFLFLIA